MMKESNSETTSPAEHVDSSVGEEALLAAWQDVEARVPRAALAQEVQLSIATAKALAEGVPLSVDDLSAVWSVPLDQARQILDAARGRSIEVDEHDHLVGAAGLSLNKTRHELMVGEDTMYAWCSWDALFLPAYLDNQATVRSTDPVTGDEITLEVGPTSVITTEPETTVLTILVPSLDSPEGLQTGPGSARCSAMHFFTDMNTAEEWVSDRTDLVILKPAQALATAHRTWLSLTN